MNRLINRCFTKTYRHNFVISNQLLTPRKPSFQSLISFRLLHDQKGKNRSTLNYVIALGVMTVGLSYAAVPLYRIFCQVSATNFQNNVISSIVKKYINIKIRLFPVHLAFYY